MATMAQALENVFADIEAIIVAITPNARPDHKFARRQPSDTPLREIKDMTGRPRLFEIQEHEIRKTRDYYTGAGYSGIEVEFPVDILYPTADRGDAASWTAAAFDDANEIQHRVLDTTTIAGDGIQCRTAWDTAEIRPFAEDPWFIMRVKITALLHVEQ